MKREYIFVDDNRLDLFVNEKVLDIAGISDPVKSFLGVDPCIDYLVSLAAGDQEHHRIIFLDINMPFKSGFDFLNDFESLPAPVRGKSTIFMLSSSLDEREIERATENPYVTKFIEKPLTKEKVTAILSDLL